MWNRPKFVCYIFLFFCFYFPVNKATFFLIATEICREWLAWTRWFLWFIYMRICVEWSTSMSIDDDDNDHENNNIDHADSFFLIVYTFGCVVCFFFLNHFNSYSCVVETNSLIPRNLNVVSSGHKRNEKEILNPRPTNWAIDIQSTWFTPLKRLNSTQLMFH